MSPSIIFYLIVGLIGMVLNAVVAVVLMVDKTMQSPTYKCMIYLAISDMEALLGVIVGPIISSFFGGANNQASMKFFAFFTASGVHCGALFLVLVAGTRWLYFSKPELLETAFFSNSKKRFALTCLFFLFLVHAIYTPFLILPNAFESMNTESGAYSCTNGTYSIVVCGFVDASLNYGSMFFQILFNSLSLIHIWKMRGKIMSAEIRTRNKQELKLFFQCAIDSLIYIACMCLDILCVYTPYCNKKMGEAYEFLLLLNSIDCAVLYLCFNRKLRLHIRQIFGNNNVLLFKKVAVGHGMDGSPVVKK